MRKVRRARPEDARGIHEAHMRSIREVCSQDHTEEEIRGWGFRPYREDQRINAIVNQHVWVVENSGKIEGYGHLSLINENLRTRDGGSNVRYIPMKLVLV